MDKKIFEQMLLHFDIEKIEEKYDDDSAGMWSEGLVRADNPYYKYCNSQWRARAHRQIEYDTYKLLMDYKKLKNENIRLLDENKKLERRNACLTNCNQKQASVIRKLKS
jgi:hypothetical protein